jgi:hypothetical protein
MASTPDEGTPPKFVPVTTVDNIGAPDVFADGLAGAFLTNGNVHMTFVTRRCDYTKQPNLFSDLVIGRLIMPLAAVENVAQFLNGYLERLRTQPPDLISDGPKTIQ